jgi:hypothetical protein
MYEVVRYKTPPQHEQEWVFEQVVKALCPVPERMLLPPETALHLEAHPLSNKGKVSLPSNSCLHSSSSHTSMFVLHAYKDIFFSILTSHWPAMDCVFLEPPMDLPFNLPT